MTPRKPQGFEESWVVKANREKREAENERVRGKIGQLRDEYESLVIPPGRFDLTDEDIAELPILDLEKFGEFEAEYEARAAMYEEVGH